MADWHQWLQDRGFPSNAKAEEAIPLNDTARGQWAKGPWSEEPERIEWRDARAKPQLVCLIQRNAMGALCGYVAVPGFHPWHGKHYDSIDADAHGGLTYSGSCEDNRHICHTPLDGEPDTAWWIGFDCGHLYDLLPYIERLREPGGTLHRERAWPMRDVYRDVLYVRSQVEDLADQVRGALR